VRTSKSFLYLEIAESLRRRIASGELQPGGRLPPVREMARRWNCTPGTVSRAYAQLAQEGLAVGHRGGGTRVTAEALYPQRPIWQWAALVNRAERFLLEVIGNGYTPAQAESALSVAISRWQELQQQDVPRLQTQSTDAPPEAGLRFAGSHDLAIALLARMLAEKMPDAGLSVDYVGSLGGLIALARSEAEVAGVHLWDETADTYNAPFVRRLLPGRRVALLTLACRSLGLITPLGNPQGLQTLADLTQPHVRLVNRQSGSGTRVWLDAQLKALDISPESVRGYCDSEELTHLAVAQAVDQGEATVGLGIYAAASAYGLDFVPLTEEQYDLVLLESVWHSPTAQALVSVARSSRFKEAVVALGGYDTSDTGQVTWIF
jgi:molybdate-binding protein/DNA-binding transcriptional regulator YhcF (GntR family)